MICANHVYEQEISVQSGTFFVGVYSMTLSTWTFVYIYICFTEQSTTTTIFSTEDELDF